MVEKAIETELRRSVRIAAVIMQAEGLCRYDDIDKCRKVFPPSDSDCVRCIELFLLSKGRKG